MALKRGSYRLASRGIARRNQGLIPTGKQECDQTIAFLRQVLTPTLQLQKLTVYTAPELQVAEICHWMAFAGWLETQPRDADQ